MPFNSEEFTIAEHYLSALINGDYSGMDDAEESDFDSWLQSAQNGRLGHWDCATESNFMRCDVTGLRADCVTATFYFRES